MKDKKASVVSKTINKLILVGNGFDLSLGLETKYEDFLFWYFQRFILKSLTSDIRTRTPDGYFVYFFNDDELFTCYNDTAYRYGPEHIDKFKTEYDSYQKLKHFILSNPNKFTYTFKSKLLRSIFEGSVKSWVDIEGAYFKLLKKELEGKKGIDQLNKDLVIITALLKEYLSQLDISKTEEKHICEKYVNQFVSSIKAEDIIEKLEGQKIKSDTYYFLNFNYTNTLTNILKHLKLAYFSSYGLNLAEPIISHIHGSLGSEQIIFGYGDEMDKDYKSIEDLEDNRFFENIKSFKYSKSHEYRNLLRFLNSGDYQVVIYGHSCGLSDRLLLNEIFEHDNCKSIKIYYYDEAEFVTKTMDISRHFKSNQLMRQKIVEFSEDHQIPQS